MTNSDHSAFGWEPSIEAGKASLSTPAVSVVIPCYNYGRYLAECVASVINQIRVRLSILVIDDASTDNSYEVAQGLAQEHPELEFVRHRRNQGHIATYNEGVLDWAQSEYVVLLSADDMLAPGALSRSSGVLDEYPRVGMVYGRSFPFTDSRSLPRAKASHGTLVYPGKQWLKARCKQGVNVVSTPEVIVRRDVQRRLGGYRAHLPHAGDFEMWLRFAAVSDIGYIGGTPQAYYRVHSASMSQRVYRHRLGDVEQRKAVFDSFFEEYPDLIRRVGIVPMNTYATLASEPLWWACRSYERGDVDEAMVAEALEFATRTYPAVQELRALKALKRRQRLGTKLCRRTQVFLPTSAYHRLESEWWWWKWRRYGG